MQHLFKIFHRLFPMTDVSVEDKALRYRFRSRVTARYFESIAQEIILENGLRLTAELETWRKNGVIVDQSLVVELVPEEYLIIQ